MECSTTNLVPSGYSRFIQEPSGSILCSPSSHALKKIRRYVVLEEEEETLYTALQDASKAFDVLWHMVFFQ